MKGRIADFTLLTMLSAVALAALHRSLRTPEKLPEALPPPPTRPAIAAPGAAAL